MRRLLPILPIFLLIALICLKILPSWRTHDEAENEDGILKAQEQEFRMTRDANLGYIPKDRLVNAYMNLMQQRGRLDAAGRILPATGAVRSGNTGPSPLSEFTWQERGPYRDAVGTSNGNSRGPGNAAVTSGRMRAIWVDLADPTQHTVWVGGIDGGLWKTSDITASPATWTLVNDFFGNLAISSICQDPTNNNIMYFGTGEKTINVDAVRGGGIWRSTDHGVSWTLLNSTTGFWNVSKILCDGSGNVYVGTIGHGQGLERSTNGGTSWTNITPSIGFGGTRITDMVLSSTGRLHVTKGYFGQDAKYSGYFYTDNPATIDSTHWSLPSTPFNPVNVNCALACKGDTLFVLNANLNTGTGESETPQIFKSVNGGVTWSATPTSPPAAAGTNDLSSGQGWYCLAIGMDPSNAANVLVGGLNCYKTTNGGSTWSQVTRWVGASGVYLHADQHAVAWAGNQVLVGSDGGLFYSADGGSTFTDRNVNLRLKQFYSVAIHPTLTNYFLAGAQDNGCHQMNSPGLGNSTEFVGGDGAFVHIDQSQPQYQFGAYVYNQYRRSTDGGNSWSSVNYSNSAGQFINPTDYDNTGKKLYAGGNAGTFIRWEDPQTGATFTPVSMSAIGSGMVTHVHVSPYTSNRVFFGSDNSKIIKADNADQGTPTYTDISGSGMGSQDVVSCVATGTDDNHLIATFSNYGAHHIWMTTTGGGSSGWTEITGNLPDIPVRWAIFYPYDNTKAMIATEMGVYETSAINGASTVWTQDTGFPVVRTDMLKYRKTDYLIAAATHGRGIWTANFTVKSPLIRFASTVTDTTVTETTAAAIDCRGYKDYTLGLTIDGPPSGDATVTFTLSGGTATQGLDFDFTTNGNFTSPSNTLTFPAGSSLPQSLTVRIYDDAVIDNTQSFTLSYAVTGTTNALAAAANTYTYHIIGNDAAPVPLTNPVETSLNASKANYLGPNQDIYFYNTNGNIMARITGTGNVNFGCTSVTIDRAGTGTAPFWNNLAANYLMNKTFRIVPSGNGSGSYQVTLYYTAAEKAAWEQTTGKLWDSIKLVRVDSLISQVKPGYPNAAGRVTIVTPVRGTYGSDYTLSYYSFAGAPADIGAGIPGDSLQLDNGGVQVLVVNNPFHSYIDVHLDKQPRQPVIFQLVSITGAQIYSGTYGLNNYFRVDLSALPLARGIYVLRTIVDGKSYANKVLRE